MGVFAHTYKFNNMLALSWDILYTYQCIKDVNKEKRSERFINSRAQH